MMSGEIRSIINERAAEELHHPLGGILETGKGLKAHDWFVIPLTAEQHRQYQLWGKATWEKRYGTHEDLLKVFWRLLGFEPGNFMVVGMESKRAARLHRVLARIT